MTTKWDARMLDLAEFYSEFSKDPSTKVGAVIARPDRTVASMGYNGFARGVEDYPDRLDNREVKYAYTVHAELNAILSAREPLHGYTIYTYPFQPCTDCSGAIIQAGIKKVVAPFADPVVYERWNKDFDIADGMLQEAGVEVVLL